MKSNNLDDIIKKKKTSNTSFYFKLAVIVFAMLAPVFIPYMANNMGQVIFLNIKEKFMFLP